MKKNLFSLVLALTLCIVLSQPVAAIVSRGGIAHMTDYSSMDEWNRDITPLTGLTMFSREETWKNIDGFINHTTYYGLRDNAGNEVFPAEYGRFGYLAEDRIIAEKLEFDSDHVLKSSKGVVTVTGEVIYPFTENIFAIVRTDATVTPDQWTNTVIIDMTTGEQEGGLAAASKQGLFDLNLNPILPLEYNDICYLEKGYYQLRKYDKALGKSLYGIYKHGIGIIIPVQYTTIKTMKEADSILFAARRPDMYCGLLDGNGNQILPFLYADITSHSKGKYFAVSIFKNEQCHQSALKNGLLFDSSEGNVFYSERGIDQSSVPSYIDAGAIDRDGNVIIPFEYDKPKRMLYPLFEMSKWNGKHHLVDVGLEGYSVILRVKTYTDTLLNATNIDCNGETIYDLLRERSLTPEGMTTPVPASTVGGFADVKKSDYFADAVQWAVEKKITSGTSANTFSPSATCSKAQILTFLWRANGSPEPTAANPFSDIKSTDYYYKAALWAAEKGMVSGSSFGASTPCTRASTMEYMWKAAGSPVASYDGKFDDVSTSADYAQAVAWAVENKITAGTSKTTFGPDSTCTRGQIVTFLHRAMGD